MAEGISSSDVVVIGGGHNGLVAAAYLARKQLSVLVLERRSLVGGCCVTEEILPGFRSSRAAYVLSLLRPRIIRDLELERHGLSLLPRNPSSFTPLPDGRSLILGSDGEENRRQVGKFSARDAEALPGYTRLLEDAAALFEPLLDRPPVDPLSLLPFGWISHLPLLVKGWKNRRLLNPLAELLLAPARSILDRWFESEPLKATLATDAIIGAMVSPSTPGSGYVLLHHVMGETGGKRGVWAYVRGGMGALSEALAAAAREAGARIETDAPVERIVVRNGRAEGVVVAGGREVRCRAVLSSADPRVTFLGLLTSSELPAEFRARIQGLDFSSSSAKINLALDGLPRFRALPGDGPWPALHGTIHISPTVDYIERAFLDAAGGRPSADPVLECTIPSTLDRSLAPEGKHVMSIFAQYAPYKLGEGRSWSDPGVKESFSNRVLDILEEYAPGFRRLVLAHEVLSPLDLEKIFGLTGGNIFHGAMSLSQLAFLRPVAGWSQYRTPISGLYLGGAGAHPGGGVLGSCGRNAAFTVIKDWREIRAS